MDDGEGLIWDNENFKAESSTAKKLFENILGTSVEELEVELRRKEKELYLCSRLGLFLAQEVEELVGQRRGILSDHTRVLLELQDLRSPSGCISKDKQEDQQPQSSSIHGKIEVNPKRKMSEQRAYSLESLDLISNCDSVMTSASTATRDLQNDLNMVQKTHDRISKLEVSLDASRAKYRTLMTSYSHKLKEISRQLGSCITKSRPYFEAVKKSRKCQLETQTAAMEYKRSVNQHKVARDMVRVAEERVMQAVDKLDPSWQEMLNHANMKVSEASKEKSRVHQLHMKAANAFQGAEQAKMGIRVKLERTIAKAQPYFDVQREFQQKLEATTKRLNALELKLLESRHSYTMMLARLRNNGDNTDKSSIVQRGAGVGAEDPIGPILASQLPRPAIDFLERLHESGDNDSFDGSVMNFKNKHHFDYNPYDLTYLNDINDVASNDDGSSLSSDLTSQDYIQDF